MSSTTKARKYNKLRIVNTLSAQRYTTRNPGYCCCRYGYRHEKSLHTTTCEPSTW